MPKQEELQKGYTRIESIHAILGVGTTKIVAIQGRTHPKMRLVVKDDGTKMQDGAGLTGDYSFALCRAFTTGGGIFQVTHKDGVVAGITDAVAAANELYPFAPAAASDETIFEANEDIILEPQTVQGSAADSALVVLKFEVVN